HQHFCASHSAGSAVREGEVEALCQIDVVQSRYVAEIPLITCSDRLGQFVERWKLGRIGRLVPMVHASQIPTENPVDDMGMVQDPDCNGAIDGMRYLVEPLHGGEELVVGPCLVPEQRLKSPDVVHVSLRVSWPRVTSFRWPDPAIEGNRPTR